MDTVYKARLRCGIFVLIYIALIFILGPIRDMGLGLRLSFVFAFILYLALELWFEKKTVKIIKLGVWE